MTEKSLDTALNEVQGIELKDLRTQIQAALPGLAGLPSLNLLLRTVENMLSRVENDVRQDIAKEKEAKEKEKEIEAKAVLKQIEEAKIQEAHKAVSDYRAEHSQLITMVTNQNRYETQQDADNAGQMLAGYVELIEKHPELKTNPEPQMVKDILIVGAATEETLAGTEPQPLAQPPSITPISTPQPTVPVATPIAPTSTTQNSPAPQAPAPQKPIPAAPNNTFTAANISPTFNRNTFAALTQAGNFNGNESVVEQNNHHHRPKPDDNCMAAMRFNRFANPGKSCQQIRETDPKDLNQSIVLRVNGVERVVFATEFGNKDVQKALEDKDNVVQLVKKHHKDHKDHDKDKDGDQKPLHPVSLPIKTDADKAKDGQKHEQKQHNRT